MIGFFIATLYIALVFETRYSRTSVIRTDRDREVFG